MQQLPRAELQWTGVSSGMRLYSSYHTLSKGNTSTAGMPQDTFLLSSLTLSQVEALPCPRQPLFPCFCRVMRDFQACQRSLSVLCQLLWLGSGVHSWEAEGQMILLEATWQPLSVCLSGLPPVLAQPAASQTGCFSTGGHGIMLTIAVRNEPSKQPHIGTSSRN